MHDENANMHLGDWCPMIDQHATCPRDVVAQYVGDYGSDYDLEAIEAEYVEKINAALPEGVVLARNGGFFCPADFTGLNRENLRLLVWEVDLAPIVIRHMRQAG